MESELMREPWSFPREAAATSLGLGPPTVPGGPASGARLGPSTGPAGGGSQLDPAGVAQQLNAWEENFQDLSTWCMAGVHARTDFHAGESTMDSKLTGSRNECSAVLTDGVTRGQLMQQQQQQQQQHATGKKVMIPNGEMARRPKPATYVVSPGLDHAYHVAGQQPQQQQHQQQQIYFNNNNNDNNLNNLNNLNNNNSNSKRSECDNDNVWLNAPTKSINNGVVWDDLGMSSNNGMMIPLQQDVKLEVIPQTRVNEDVLQTLEAEAAGSFDLLSYLCEDMVFQDEVPSPVDSASTDSSRVTDAASLPSNSSAHVVVSPRTYEPISLATVAKPEQQQQQQQQQPATTKQLRRSSGYQLRTIVKLEKPESPEPPERRSARARRPSRASSSASSRGKGRKRFLESESDNSDEGEDEDGDADEGYRETREKNNEASRKSRMNKKAKEMEMARRSVELEKDNRILKMKVDELEKLVNSMRNALLRSALRRDPLKPPGPF